MKLRVAFVYGFNDRDWLGGRNYFSSLFNAISACEAGNIQVALVLGRNTDTSLPEEFTWLRVLRTAIVDLRLFGTARKWSLRMFDKDIILGNYLRRHGMDVLSHSQCIGRQSDIKTLPWLYDFQFMHYPELWKPKQLRWIERSYVDACRHSTGIIVSSKNALRDLENLTECGTPKYILPFISNPIDIARLPSRSEITERYALPERYLYMPNQFWSHKNHKLVVDALSILKKNSVEATIVCTGKTFDERNPSYFSGFMDYCLKKGVKEKLKILGVVPYGDTQGLMAYANAVLNPSRFEGWSTTVEEAKTMHKKILLSDIAVHREQVPVQGGFFPVDDPAALSELIRGCLVDRPADVPWDLIKIEYGQRLRSYGKTYLSILESAVPGWRAECPDCRLAPP